MSLIKTTAELKLYASQFATNMSFDIIKPILEGAELDYIIPVIGEDFFNELDEAYNEGTPTAAQDQLIKKLQRCLAFYTAFDLLNSNTVSITGAGTFENIPQNAAPARQWLYEKSLQACINRADKFFDVALQYLEDNENLFDTWKSSDEYTVSKSLFINKTSDFSKFVDLCKSRRTFLKLRPFISLVEEKYIIPTIGQELFDELKEQQESGSLTTANKDLINKYIQRPVAHFTIVEAIPSLTVEVKGNGLIVHSSSDGINQSAQANDKQILSFGESNLNNGNTYLANLKKYLEDNSSSYPTYASSSSLNNGQPNTDIHDNTGKKSFFI